MRFRRSFFSGGFFSRFVRGGTFLTGTTGDCFFVDLSQHHCPGGWFVAAAAGRFVEAEGLEGPVNAKKSSAGAMKTPT
jgi:hypothetical protein